MYSEGFTRSATPLKPPFVHRHKTHHHQLAQSFTRSYPRTYSNHHSLISSRLIPSLQTSFSADLASSQILSRPMPACPPPLPTPTPAPTPPLSCLAAAVTFIMSTSGPHPHVASPVKCSPGSFSNQYCNNKPACCAAAAAAATAAAAAATAAAAASVRRVAPARSVWPVGRSCTAGEAARCPGITPHTPCQWRTCPAGM